MTCPDSFFRVTRKRRGAGAGGGGCELGSSEGNGESWIGEDIVQGLTHVKIIQINLLDKVLIKKAISGVSNSSSLFGMVICGTSLENVILCPWANQRSPWSVDLPPPSLQPPLPPELNLSGLYLTPKSTVWACNSLALFLYNYNTGITRSASFICLVCYWVST